MPLNDKKYCAHCGTELTDSPRRVVSTYFDFPDEGEPRRVQPQDYLCIACYRERQNMHRKIDRDFLKGEPDARTQVE